MTQSQDSGGSTSSRDEEPRRRRASDGGVGEGGTDPRAPLTPSGRTSKAKLQIETNRGESFTVKIQRDAALADMRAHIGRALALADDLHAGGFSLAYIDEDAEKIRIVGAECLREARELYPHPAPLPLFVHVVDAREARAQPEEEGALDPHTAIGETVALPKNYEAISDCEIPFDALKHVRTIDESAGSVVYYAEWVGRSGCAQRVAVKEFKDRSYGEPFYSQDHVGRGWGIMNGALGAARLLKILVLNGR